MRNTSCSLVACFCALALSACAATQRDANVVGEYLSGRLAAQANNIDDAADAFALAEAQSSSTSILRSAFFFQLAAGNIAAAEPLAQKLAAMEDSGDDGLGRITLALIDIRNGDYESAREHLTQAEEAKYLTSSVRVFEAWATEGLEGPQAAVALINKTSGDEYKGFYPLHVALLADKDGRKEEARAAFQLSFLARSGAIDVEAYGAFLERTGDEAAAREFYDLIAENSSFGAATARMAYARLEKGKPSQALYALKPAQGAAVMLHGLADAILDQTTKQRQAAIDAGFNVPDPNYDMPLAMTQLALYLDPTLVDARRVAGSIFRLYGQYEKAIDILIEVPRSSAYYESSRIEIAGAYAAMERTDDAIALLRKTATAPGAADQARLSYAGYLSSRDRFEEAVDVLDTAIATLPEKPETGSWRFFVSRAASLLELNDWERAEADLKRAVEIAPEEPTALNYLGYSWAERGENLEEAFELIEKAVALQPNSGPIIDSLGWAHFQLGHYQDAVGHLEQAASLEPADPTITDHLGDVYWRLGRPIEARYQWRRVLELNPDAELRATTEGKIIKGLPEIE